jgi:hypothetical protein
MKPVSLSDLNPQGSSFTLQSTGKTYRMRPVTLADEKWLAETFGTDLQKIFQEMRMLQVARIVFHQLVEEDKADFAQVEVTVMNEEGLQTKRKMGGAELLFWQIRGLNEKVEIFKALMETIGISREIQSGIDADVQDEEKKRLESLRTGPGSSIDLAQSTGGQPNTSGPEL